MKELGGDCGLACLPLSRTFHFQRGFEVGYEMNR